MRVRLRPRAAGPGDEPFLRELLWLAVHWDSDPPPPIEDPLPAELARYVDGFGSAGDWGVVAAASGDAIGGAWWRTFTAAEPGYGFVAEDIPELSIAVRRPHRGSGVGTALLEALVEEARRRGLPGLSLSVTCGNPARTLYERAGFEAVGGADWSVTMVRRFGRPG